MTLNLTAKGTEQEILKKYLEENASEVLAEKINNGVRIVKDGITLISSQIISTKRRHFSPVKRLDTVLSSVRA